MPLIDLPLPSSPSLWLEPVSQAELSLGAFQRAASALKEPSFPVTRRLSGGPTLLLAPESLHLVLYLPSPSVLVPDADLPRLLNRHLRPLLRALRRLGLAAMYPGRDWIAVAHRPAIWVGFAHHGASNACCVEAFLPLDRSFSVPSEQDASAIYRSEPPWLGKVPAGLRELSPHPLSLETLHQAVTRAYATDLGVLWAPGSFEAGWLRREVRDERPPWAALRQEAIGLVGASGPPWAGLGGEFFASEDLMAAVDRRLEELPRRATRGQLQEVLVAAVEETGGRIEGVCSVDSLLDVLEEAFA
ncbi:MAG: hypothetical protein RMJ98_09885 [Myxococcales bacterium]|nr:hypothetical protein [Polyangiaceae bacterium]MDW8249599.1 hypothetical protein [Myxococcales bacterium]